MNYLITGGTGFVGPYIAKLLVKEGHGVIVYDLNTSRQPLEKVMGKEASDKVKIVKGDITDLANLIHVTKDNDVNVIIHMAALLTMACAANPTAALNVNCYGTLNVLETARILGLKKVVYASTGALFGPPEVYGGVEYIPNDAPHAPVNLYGACKSFVESLAKHYLKDFKVDSIGLRFPLPYGPGMTGGAAKLVEELIVKPALGKPGIAPNGDGVVNWLYVEDAARAVYMASNVPATPTAVFNVNCDVHPVREAADVVRKLIPGADIKLIPGSHGLSLKWDASRIEKEIGYTPEYTIEKAFQEIIDDARKKSTATTTNRFDFKPGDKMTVKHNFASKSNNVYMIDTKMFGFEHFNSAYLIKGKELALIDTGLSRNLDDLLAGIKSHGFSVDDLSYVFCTHEHHDHCDNVGPLLRMNPRIKAYMHEKVKYALTNTEAIAEAMKKSVSPEQFAKFGKVEAVAPELCNILKDGDVFDLGDGERLQAIYAAGHQPGSYVFFAEKFGGLFINDLPGFYMADADSFIMNTPFGADMIKAQENLKKLLGLPVKTLFLGHFGISDKPEYVINGAANFIQSMLDIGVQCVKEGNPDQIEPRTKALRLAQADKLKGIREPEMVNYVVTELIGRQCAIFAKYFLASGYAK